MDALIQWALTHTAIIGGLVIGVLDFLFALVPTWESNGILHWLYLQAKKLLPGG